MNDIIEPMEIGKIKNRYKRVNISEFDIEPPPRRKGLKAPQRRYSKCWLVFRSRE